MHPFAALEEATSGLEAPFAVVDLDAFDRNADSLVERAAGKPVRVASKSVRCRALIDRALSKPGFSGILAFTLPEALWLAEDHEDVVVGYPTADRTAVRTLVGDPWRAERVTLMVDSTEHLDFLESVAAEHRDTSSVPPLRVCLDLDASLRLLHGRLHLGMRRSPVHDPADLRRLALDVQSRQHLRLVGVMAYEGQIAGVPDNAGSRPRRLAVQAFQQLSAEELRRRRARAVAAVREVADLEFVNGGGTGSLERTAAEAAVTEVAAGSGLLAPALFDSYSRFHLEPAAWFALRVVRRPAPTHATVLGGGWIASGASGPDRLPVPTWPPGLALVKEEGAGEVQTPLQGEGAPDLRLGDLVWFRHAKAGELCEHVEQLHLVRHATVAATVPTYRGERHTFL